MHSSMTEQTALVRIKEGDEAGLRWIIQQYTAYVGSIVWGITGGRITQQDVEEITADVFMVLWRNRTRPRDGKLKGYLATIARNRAIDYLRKVKQEQPLEYDALEIAVDGPEGEILVQEGVQILRSFLETMGAQDREIFVRHYYLGETALTIGQYLDMSPETVRQRLKRGRDFLRQQIKKGDVL